jgi:hypothetical protein
MKRGFLMEASVGVMILYTLLIFVASWIVFQIISLFYRDFDF